MTEEYLIILGLSSTVKTLKAAKAKAKKISNRWNGELVIVYKKVYMVRAKTIKVQA